MKSLFFNYEMDLGFKISVKDPSGNPRVISFDELGTLIDEKPEDPEGQELTARIDTITPSHLKSSSYRLRQAELDPDYPDAFFGKRR